MDYTTNGLAVGIAPFCSLKGFGKCASQVVLPRDAGSCQRLFSLSSRSVNVYRHALVLDDPITKYRFPKNTDRGNTSF